MEIFTVTLVVMIMILATIFVSVRCFRHSEISDRRSRFAPFVMLSCIMVILSDVFLGGNVISRLPCDLTFSLAALLLIVSSLWEEDDLRRAMVCMMSVHLCLILYYVTAALGLLPLISHKWFVRMSCIGPGFIITIFLTAIHLRIREVRLVIKHGNVWSCLCIMVDMVYVLFVMMYIFIFCVAMSCSPWMTVAVSHIVSILLALEFGAIGFRIACDSVFVLRSRHERRIIESMKISHVEISPDSSKVEEMYRNIYERVVQLFEKDLMYLNSELTINDIVKIVYTNKLYISRAISQFTGRNFCQFVNYYRVIHSIRLFRENPDLKVAELANQSGFNSSVTFGMAFRLYMSESPSDWCRKEKYKITGKKK